MPLVRSSRGFTITGSQPPASMQRLIDRSNSAASRRQFVTSTSAAGTRGGRPQGAQPSGCVRRSSQASAAPLTRGDTRRRTSAW